MILKNKCNWEAIDLLELDGSAAIIVSFTALDFTTEHYYSFGPWGSVCLPKISKDDKIKFDHLKHFKVVRVN